jgi:hypothetical protein
MKMKRSVSISLGGALFLAMLGFAGTPVQAQFYGGYWGGYYVFPPPAPVPPAPIPAYGALPFREIGRMLAEDGLRLVAPPRRRGHTYLANVVDQRGRHRLVTLDIYDGTILSAAPLAQPAPKPPRLAKPSNGALPNMAKPNTPGEEPSTPTDAKASAPAGTPVSAAIPKPAIEPSAPSTPAPEKTAAPVPLSNPEPEPAPTQPLEPAAPLPPDEAAK